MEELLRDFDARRSYLDDLAPRIRDLLGQLLAERGLLVHSVAARVKERPSLERKVRRHKPPYRSLGDVTDLVGARIVTYFTGDVDEVAKVIEDEFSIDLRSRDPRAAIEPDRFGYLSLHYVVTLSPARLLLPEWARFAGLAFEIQIRTILQHAWAEIEHDRGYHTPDEVPPHVRRRWSRVAALLEIADSEFMTLRGEALPASAGSREQIAALRPAVLDDRIASISQTSAGFLSPGSVSRGTFTILIVLRHPPVGVRTTIRMRLETPNVEIVGTPILSAADEIDASSRIEDGRAIEITFTGQTSAPYTLSITGLKLSAGPGARHGPVQMSASMDGHPGPALLPPIGTIGVATDVYGAVDSAVLIRDGDQATFPISIVERAAGSLQYGHTLRLSLVDMSDPTRPAGYEFVRSPWIKVATGDLRLGDGGAPSPDNTIEGRIAGDDRSSASWSIWKVSNVPSRLLVGDAGFTVGPTIRARAHEGPATIGLSIETVDATGASHARSLVVLGFRPPGDADA